ncbi:hypothetical protein DWY34_14515 [Blautia sp. AF25-12LB]|jgi:hypothetical protein|nr:hypothetical protein DWY34_14515 [Blautia sp. AF25-12LB]RHQ76101.1 hypothetical protein DWX98_13715 [Blautia sp. AF22-5LB]RHS51644.1 hypothetical protein DW962_08190 [Blautia sp. AM46-5]RHS57739.1 hypothetical protein DW961_05495 [Blautia sp. AM46-3MH]
MPDFKAYPKRPQNAFGSHSNSHGLTAGECPMPNGSTGKDVDLVWLPKGKKTKNRIELINIKIIRKRLDKVKV